MEARAIARYQPYSWRKVKPILDLIRNKQVPVAYRILNVVPRRAKNLVYKTLKSAVANLTYKNKNIDLTKIVVKTCYVTQAPCLKRFRAGPMGRAMMYKKRFCHLTIVVGSKEL
jgi:large subunit ribosomal protein L22